VRKIVDSVKAVRRGRDRLRADLELDLRLEFKKRLRTGVEKTQKILFHPGLTKLVGGGQNEPVGGNEVTGCSEEPGFKILMADSMLHLFVKNPGWIFFRGDAPVPRKPRYHMEPPAGRSACTKKTTVSERLQDTASPHG
jgi:hypothetical protein